MGRFSYLDASKVIPSQDYLKGRTMQALIGYVEDKKPDLIPPPPIVLRVEDKSFVALDGHNLIALQALQKRRCMVYVMDSISDSLHTPDDIPISEDRKESVKERIQELEGDFFRYQSFTFEELIEAAWTKEFSKFAVRKLAKRKVDRVYVVGRFQPFHIQHLEYLREAFSVAAHVTIGISMPFTKKSSQSSQAAEHRIRKESNPLLYHERKKMITAALHEDGHTSDIFEFCPFPLDDADELENFVERGKKIVSTLCDAWNQEKKDVLEKAGHEVVYLIDRVNDRIGEPRVTANLIRGLASTGNQSWKCLVQKSVQDYLESIRFEERVK